MARYRYPVDILPGEDGKDYYVVVPALPGCFSQGRSIEEAKKNINEAIQLKEGNEKDRFKRPTYFGEEPKLFSLMRKRSEHDPIGVSAAGSTGRVHLSDHGGA